MKVTSAIKTALFVMLALFVTAVLAGSAARQKGSNATQSSTPAQKAGSASDEDCAVCHEDLSMAFVRTPHGVLQKSPSYALENSCESCHGPGEDHAVSDGDITKIFGFNGAVAKKGNDTCLSCHDRSHDLAAYKSGLHARSGLSCSDCHSAHASVEGTRQLKAAPNELCQSCHIQTRADFSRPFHHSVAEGLMRCVDCHQPHQGFERRQLRTSHAGEEACAKCHLDKSGPFVFEHASLRIRDCQACHEPHGAYNPRMLVRNNVRALCLECHSGSVNVFSNQPPAFHDVRSPRFQNCTSCHVKIHGSNASRLFLR